MPSSYASCAFYLRDHGIKRKDLEGLPGPLRGMDSHVVRRLACEGVLTDAKKDVLQGGSLRRVWRPGPCFDKVMRLL